MTASGSSASRPWLDLSTLGLWVGAVVLAVFLAMLLEDSAVFGGVYVPQGNDSFYHARRVLDALGERGFYEFDARVHAPDGRVVPWPWAYDYMLTAIARVGLWLNPSGDPLALLFYVPVAFILINAALFLAAAGALRLSIEMRAIAMLCFALSPLTQLLHGFGMLDHHYVEYTFVLLQIWLGLQWFTHPESRRWSAALGVALGIAPAFHVGLFVLQVAPLACAFVLWLRRREPPPAALVAFAVSLVAGTLLALLPSTTFRDGYYEFGLLSWFHLHAAVCTAVAMLFMAWRRHSPRSLIGLVILAAVVAAPGAVQLGRGASFISSDFSALGEIDEAQSVYGQMTRSLGLFQTVARYSWLLLLAPVLLLWNAYSLATAREADRLFYAAAGVFGLLLLLAQFRFHYYGFFALVTGGLIVGDRLRQRYHWHRGATVTAVLGLVLLSYQPPLRERLFQVSPPGLDPMYPSLQPLYLRLATECAAEPGVVLANANDGNPILFHSDCGVITNTMFASAEDDAHLRRARELYSKRPEEIRETAPEVRYVLVRTTDFAVEVDGRQGLLDIPIVTELLLAPEPPAGFSLLQTVGFGVAASADEVDVYARLYKVEPAHSGAH